MSNHQSKVEKKTPPPQIDVIVNMFEVILSLLIKSNMSFTFLFFTVTLFTVAAAFTAAAGQLLCVTEGKQFPCFKTNRYQGYKLIGVRIFQSVLLVFLNIYSFMTP